MGMTTGHGGKDRTTLSEINVTPLVDVMLVLLIIFMVTAPMIKQGVDVELPKTETIEVKTDVDENDNFIVVTHDRKIYLSKTEIPFDQLQEKIQYNLNIRKDEQLSFYADKRLDYEFVIQVMAKLQKAGIKNLAVATEPEEFNKPTE